MAEGDIHITREDGAVTKITRECCVDAGDGVTIIAEGIYCSGTPGAVPLHITHRIVTDEVPAQPLGYSIKCGEPVKVVPREEATPATGMTAFLRSIGYRE